MSATPASPAVLCDLTVCRSGELGEKLAVAQDQLRQADSDLDQVQGEKANKYKDLKLREQVIRGEGVRLWSGRVRAVEWVVCCVVYDASVKTTNTSHLL